MFEWLRESTWGYPIIDAIHVLGLAWFGGAVLFADARLVRFKRIGLALMLITGAFLFALHPGRYSGSLSFRVKLLLMIAVLLTPRDSPRWAIALWIAIIFASRGIAFF
jgi:hypothetical protein